MEFVEARGEFDDGSVFVTSGGQAAWMPARIVAESKHPTIPYDVSFRASIVPGSKGHHYAVDELLYRRRDDGPPITTRGIRSIPVPTLLARAVQVSAWPLDVDTDGNIVGLVHGASTLDATRLAHPRRIGRSAGQGQKIPDSELEKVARVYRAGSAEHRGIQEVADEYDVGRTTAHRAIKRAGAAGLLAQPKKGRKR